MIRVIALGLAMAGALASGAAAACRQALVLGLDVSGSVDRTEYRMQVEGLARSLDNPDVRDMLLSTPEFPIRIAVFEWSGPLGQHLILPFTEISDAATLDTVILAIAAAERRPDSHTTAIGSAMQTGFDLLSDQSQCLTLTLDLSGDGPSNSGPRPRGVSPPPEIGTVTVNGLVVADSALDRDRQYRQVGDLAAYYEAYVIRGPGAFVEAAFGYSDYESAMTRKLLRELTSIVLGDVRTGRPPAAIIAQ
jgi:hypothetical protein